MSSTNTDGLPTLLGQDLEIAILDAPLSLFELLDAVSSDGDNQLFDICFDNENILERQRELEELFPSKELVTQILSTVEIDENESAEISRHACGKWIFQEPILYKSHAEYP